ncbi:MAG: hypothetical protein GY940_36335, partial [bacterium]|nr:hypothetical protein [bacterium]
EFRRAYWNETPDEHLVKRHEREIFPLLRQRSIFAEVVNFLFYDFHLSDGSVDENVIAYSNNWENRPSLVFYHNKYRETAGWVKQSVPFCMSTGETPVRRDLARGLGLTDSDDHFVIFRDQVSGLEYIRSSKEIFEKGLYVVLRAFDRHVFLDFREVEDGIDEEYEELAKTLNGKGVHSIDEMLKKNEASPGIEESEASSDVKKDCSSEPEGGG